MAEEFVFMRVRNMLTGNLPYKVELDLPPFGEPDWNPPTEQHEDGTFRLPLVYPKDDARHLALGRFMDAWSRLEMGLEQLLSGILKLNISKLPALMNSLGTKGVLDVITAQAHSKVDENRAQELAKLIERVKENNTRRNYLAHGKWMLEWTVVDHGGRPAALPRVYRIYTPTDPVQAAKLEEIGNRKERLRYMFAPKRIEAIAKAILQLVDDLQAFTRANFPMVTEGSQQTVQFGVRGSVFRTPSAEPSANDRLSVLAANPFIIRNLNG